MEEESMRKMMNKVAGNMKVTVAKAAMLLKDKKGENYVDTAVKILIAVVIGALLLAGLYALFGDVVILPQPAAVLRSANRQHVRRFQPFQNGIQGRFGKLEIRLHVFYDLVAV